MKFLTRIALVAAAATLLICVGFVSLGKKKAKKPVYLFSYFKDNGQDGLHLAYSYDGLTWTALKNDKSFLTPTAGKDKLMRDPCVVQGPDGLFHMVWTVSWNEKRIGLASSRDLINWSEQRTIPVMEQEVNAKNCWAPEIFYDDATKQYVIFWATSIPGRYPETDNDRHAGYENRNRNHRMYYVTSRDLKTFSPAKLFYDHGFSVIDATILKHGKRYVMILKNETDKPFTPEKNIRISYSDKAVGPWSAPSEPIHGKFWAEGPTPLKIGDTFLVYFDRYIDHRYGAVQSKDLEHWEDISDRIQFPKGVRHGTAFEVTEEVLKKLQEVQ